MQLPLEWWFSYVQLVLSDDENHLEIERRLIGQTESIPVDRLSPSAWHELFRICMFSGLFILGQAVRLKASHAYLGCAEMSSAQAPNVKLALSQCLENGDAEGSKRLLERLASLGESERKLRQGHWFRELLCFGKLQPLIFDASADSVENRMLEATSGQNIAIVGPAPTSTPNGAEIDSFGRVIKFNYRGGEQGCDPSTQGTRVDISYYNNGQAEYISKNAGQEFPGGLQFPVFIKPRGLKLLHNRVSYGRVIESPKSFLFNSEFHAGTSAAVDTLRFCPARLKIFNSDLMLSAGRYKGYWRPGTKPVNYCLSFAKTHDPFMQYHVLHRLWSLGVLEGDARFTEIMAGGLDQYIQELQAAHGSQGKETLCLPEQVI
ncbi:hypothetical protein [Marinobacter confluentis]|uniref:Uncharacterized protein n=1 Tax=Marinobacter confluentis TaxID=1697557 RepID=A0A4Z1BML5_9GAMM|nr:hypothetical protein [Marinobacter confluentis]TGN38524.1 hypothetical protein E5Q11_15265 [Marinobacter confluentis]